MDIGIEGFCLKIGSKKSLKKFWYSIMNVYIYLQIPMDKKSLKDIFEAIFHVSDKIKVVDSILSWDQLTSPSSAPPRLTNHPCGPIFVLRINL